MPPEALLPTGRVTIVFTDIEHSSRMASDLGDAAYFDQLRNPHQQILLDGFQRHRGVAVHTAGDSFMAVFQDADDALACATAIQQRLTAASLTAAGKTRSWTLRVRIGVHTTEQDVVPGKLAWIPDADLVAGQVEYSGTDTNFAARIASLGAAGQIIVSHGAYRAAETRTQHAWQAWPNRRLKSFEAAPETVWELLYDGQSRGEPGSRWVPDWYRGELNRYIARPELQARIVDHFKTGRDTIRRRLVTLYGEGGMGKSRLAVACAIEMVALFQHGVTFVNLARDEDDDARWTRESVAQEIGLALGLSGQDLNPNHLLDSLRSAERLLVLDNYESVDSKDVRLFIRDLIAQTSSLCLLVTSRTPVNLPDVEQIVSLGDGMTEAQARSLFLAYVALTGRGPDWTPDADDERDLARVLTLTERIPLAVELAAAWAGSRSIKEIADGLQKTPLGRMSRTPGDADRADPSPHHYSLTRSLDWSYGLLDAAARAAFAPLCLFASDFDREAAASTLVLERDEAEDVLDQLHRASLVRRTELNQTSRYALHRFTRAYAAVKLAGRTEADSVHERFVAHYRRVVHDNSDLNDPAHRAISTSEWQNVVAAMQAAEARNDWASVVALSEIGAFLNLRGMRSEQERVYLSALAAAKKSEDLQSEGRVLISVGNLHRLGGLLDQSEQAFKESRAICRTLGDSNGEAVALGHLGASYGDRGEWSKAEQVFEECLAIWKATGNRGHEARALGSLGIIYANRGEWNKAKQKFANCLSIFREVGDRRRQSATLLSLGNLLGKQESWDRAEQCYEECLIISRELGDRDAEWRAYGNLGEVYESRDQWEKAEEQYAQSLTAFQEMGDPEGTGWAHLKLGGVYRNRGDLAGSEKAYRESLLIRRSIMDQPGGGETLICLAELMQAQGKQNEAVAHAQESVAVLEKTEDAAALTKAQELLKRLLSM